MKTALGALRFALRYKTVISSHQAAGDFSWCQALKPMTELAVGHDLGSQLAVAAPRCCCCGAMGAGAPGRLQSPLHGARAHRACSCWRKARAPGAGKGPGRAGVRVQQRGARLAAAARPGRQG